MKRQRLLWKLYPAYLGVVLLALGVVAWHAARTFAAFYYAESANQLTIQAQVLVAPVRDCLLQQQPERVPALVANLYGQTPTRVTVVLPNGKVIADTDEELAQLDNHRDRQEILRAMADGHGVSQRFSNTLGQRLMYVAVPVVSAGTPLAVVRTALPLTAIEATLAQLRLTLLMAVLAMVVLVMFLTYALARRIIQPLEDLRLGAERFADGDFHQPIPGSDTIEINSLASSMNQMAQQLKHRFDTITRQNAQITGILTSMVEGVIALNTQTRVISINAAAAQMLAVEPDQAQGKELLEVVRQPALAQVVERALAGESPVEGDLVFHRHGDHFIQVHATLLHDSAGQQAGVVIVLNDVTRLRRLENLRRDFVANVSHELRTPITSIKGFVETLLDGAIESAAETQHFLDIILRQTNRLNAIIEDLLLLSRLERENGQAALGADAWVALQPILTSAVQCCTNQAQARQIEIEIDSDAQLRAPINPLLIEQAVINLISNAIIYSNGPNRIVVRTDSDSGFVRIHVQDFGIGIAAEHQARLFERFYRVDKARSRKVGGTGLGLAIVKHIVQAHGGHVSVESAVGVGTTFTVHLPVPVPVPVPAANRKLT